MSRKLVWIGFISLFSIAIWAQQSQQSGQEGTVRNDRSSTMPKVGVSAGMPQQNLLVGCVGQSGKNFVLNQSEQRRSYQLRGDTSHLQNNVGKLVKVKGRLVLGQPPAFEVQQVETVQPTCNYAKTSSALPAGGKTGAEGTAFNDTSTASIGHVTPGVQTEPGVRQNPSMKEKGQQYGANPNPPKPPTASQGAPPDPRAENPAEAQRIADSAAQSELSSREQLGVNARPNYSTADNAKQNQVAVENQAEQVRGQASGSQQVLKGGAKQAPAGQQAEQIKTSSESAPVFNGCVVESANQLWLVDKATGERFEIKGDQGKLKQHLNHEVRIVGNKTGTYGPAVGTSGNTVTIHVQAIEDTAATCTQRK